MIDGAGVKTLKFIPDERGRVLEIFRSDDENFKKFGQVYVTTTYPGVVKAWHLHKKQTDIICCVSGDLHVVLFDGRASSPTNGEVLEVDMGEKNPCYLMVPPGVYHGWKCVSEREAVVVNVPSEPYDHEVPDEYRRPPDATDIPYKWALTPGKTHG
jgi:dTDP-4-dehydrorhamnose 3,5-epimerase